MLPKECHVWRRSDRINGNVVNNGGLKCPSNKEMAIDGLNPGDKVIIVYDAEGATDKEIIWAIGDGSSDETLEGPRATATINGVEAVSGETTIASGAEITINSVTPAENGSGYIVFQVKKGMIIQQIAVIPAQEIAEDIYTVVGDEALTGANWDVEYRGSEMDLNSETGLYEWNSTPVDILEGTELGFKIVKNNAYENGEWPAGYGNNWVIKIGATEQINKAGNYTFNITFDPATGNIGVNATYNGEPTGIASIKAAQLEGAAVYTLQGVRVNNVKKGGMYIINGRKVAVK